jgi:2-iminobutanoate/2-iminopropanoate deaminase
MASPTPVHTAQAPAAIGPYSQAVACGGFLFTSGQIALRPDGSLVEGGVPEQTAQVLHNLRAVLEAAGCAPTDVVKTTVFLRDMADFPVFNEIYATFFGDHRPARSTVAVLGLPKDVRVEIEAIATIPEGRPR